MNANPNGVFTTKDHLVFFIDFLGFAEAVANFTETELATLIAVLRDLALLKSEFEITEQQVTSGISFDIRPAVTTFSDHIVISYPIEEIERLGSVNKVSTVLMMAQRMVSSLAAVAMQLGLLIRGGVTIGPLYHSGGVVLGRAMNEAYRLESQVAIYPRIVVSRKVYAELNVTGKPELILEDRDGIRHFNYFPYMILAVTKFDLRFKEQLNNWLAAIRRIAAENILRFEKLERWNEMSKWVWFQSQIEQARAGLANEIFEEEAKLPDR